MLMGKEGLSVLMIGYMKVSLRMSRRRVRAFYIIVHFDISIMVSGQVICQMVMVMSNGRVKR
jgi:hypothetical protein